MLKYRLDLAKVTVNIPELDQYSVYKGCVMCLQCVRLPFRRDDDDDDDNDDDDDDDLSMKI